MQGLFLAGWAGPEEKEHVNKWLALCIIITYKEEGDVCGTFLHFTKVEFELFDMRNSRRL